MPKIIENLRETIVQEGRKLMSNKGYKELNVREIAKNCNIALSSYKLAQLIIISNLIYLNTNKYISFDELYNSLKI